MEAIERYPYVIFPDGFNKLTQFLAVANKGKTFAVTQGLRTDVLKSETYPFITQDAGCAAVVCGPGDIEQAHAADEFVSIAQIESCLAFLAKLSERMRA